MFNINTKINDSVVISAESNSNNTIVSKTRFLGNSDNAKSITNNDIVAKTRFLGNLLVIKLGN